ncbi:MAG: GyrI-like domain-containing protein [Lentisphaerae bacterium]|nr:GyrI-like domain-containing protein [Lentisphaerota bacterium]MCP4101604.1 GyrI-like domain-containing protein [Lentisphaerota bacterium]
MKKKKYCKAGAAVLLLCLLVVMTSCTSTKTAYERTPSGMVQVKKIPKLYAFSTTANGNYYVKADAMFGKLFTYLKDNDLKMTVPVEGRQKPATMMFFVTDPEVAKDLRDCGNVKVKTIPARMVVSAGLNGRYTKANFEEGKEMIEKWLKENPNYQQDGEFFSVYWNSPYVPWFMRKQEVNMPVKSLFMESTDKPRKVDNKFGI